jgi:lipid-binding SYLF domain-containing protein
MKKTCTIFAAGLLGLAFSEVTLRGAAPETATVESAADVLHALGNLPLQGIPQTLLRDARGVAVIPHVLKAGLVIGGRYGRGVVLVRQTDGTWGNPVFVTLTGGGIGWQAGVQSSDLVLVFKTTNGLDRILRGRSKITLGADVAVAAGPVGRQAEAATDGQLKAEIYSYARSRGLFAGLSVEGAGILIDFGGNEAFYRLRGGRPADVMAVRAVPVTAESLRGTLATLSSPPAPPPVIYPSQPSLLPGAQTPPPVTPPLPPPPGGGK